MNDTSNPINSKSDLSKNWEQITSSIITTGLGFIIFIYSAIFSFSPINGEDYALALSLDKNNLPPLEKLLEIIHKSLHQASTWNARLGEQLSIFWLSTSKPIFVAANTLTFIMFCTAIAKLASHNSEKKEEFSLKLFIAMTAIFILWPRYEVFFWGTTVAGYLMPITATLWALTFFQNPKSIERSKLKSLTLIFLCLASGYSFENVPAAVLPYMLLISFIEFRNRSAARYKLTIATGVYACSWIALMFTPSTIHRAQWYREALKLPKPSLDFYISQTPKVIESFIHTSLPLLASTAAILLFSLTARRKTKNNYRVLPLSIPFAICILSVIASPYIEPRAFLLSWCILIVFLVSWSAPLLKEISSKHTTLTTALLSLAAITMGTYILTSYVDWSNKVNMRTEHVQQRIGKTCETDIEFQIIKTNYDPRILNNRDDWVENNIERVGSYYGCKLKPKI